MSTDVLTSSDAVREPQGITMSKKNRRQKGGKPPGAAGQRRGPNATLDEHRRHGNVLQPPLAGLFSPEFVNADETAIFRIL